MKKYFAKDFTNETIAIIGSSSLKPKLLKLAQEFELYGNRVVMSHIFSKADGYELTDTQLENAIKNGHERIDSATELILVYNDHIGNNTFEEIVYAINYGFSNIFCCHADEITNDHEASFINLSID